MRAVYIKVKSCDKVKERNGETMVYRVVVFDDDMSQCEIIKNMLDKCDEYEDRKYNIICIDSLRELENFIAFENEIDILVTDICVENDKKTGIDLVKKLHPKMPDTQIIYITGYVEYCEAVYETEHISFLRKPVNAERLWQAMDRAVRNIDACNERVCTVNVGRNLINIRIDDILYIESAGRKLIYRCSDRDIEIYGRLSEVEQTVGSGFVHCHKSFLVNIRHICELRDNNLLLDNGTEIAVSRNCYMDTKKRIISYTE